MLDAAVELIGRSGCLGSVTVDGVSMHPTFGGVERLAVEFSPKSLHYGDILVFRQRETLVVHRLVQRRRRGGELRLRTRGDGTIAFDLWLEPERVIGRVVAVGYPGGVWRNVRGSGGRLYARLLGAHGLCWGALGAVAIKYGGSGGPDWQRRLGWLDRFMLAIAHALLFRVFNPVVPAPRFDAVASPESSGAEARCYTSPRDRSDRKKNILKRK